METIPIIRLGEVLLTSIQVDMHDQLIQAFRDDLTQRIQQEAAKGVLIDVSALDVIDTYMATTLSGIAETSRLLGAAAVVVGLQPAVAITLAELGLTLPGVATALNVEKGLQRLKQLVAES